jgi:hypothetical protein
MGRAAVGVVAVSVDKKVYELARVWLMNTGWYNDVTITKLAERIQDCIEDFEADLENELD